MEFTCDNCGLTRPTKQPHQKICSKQCRYDYKYGGATPLKHIPAGTVGALAELSK